MSLVDGDTYGPIERDQAIATVHAALEAGITFFDNAPMYGGGQAEEVLGEALAGRRSPVVIATKVGAADLSADRLVASCEASLRRLRTDVIDLLQVHWPNHDVPAAETAGALELLRQRGLIRAFGVCNYGPRDLAEFLAVAPCASNQVVFNLLARGAEFELEPMCAVRSVPLLCYSPLAQGLLTGRFESAADVPPGRSRTRHFRGDKPPARHGGPGLEDLTFATVRRLRAIAREAGHSVAELSLAWLLRRPTVGTVLVGASRPDQVARNLRAEAVVLDTTLIGRLEAATSELKDALGPCLDLWAKDSRVR